MNIKENTHEVQEIGTLEKKIIRLLGLNFSCRKVMINPGAIKHIKKKHPGAFKKYFARLPEIIALPDYVGKNLLISDSVELVKRLKGVVLVSIIKGSNGLLYVSSFYSIGEFTLRKGISSGRLLGVDC